MNKPMDTFYVEPEYRLIPARWDSEAPEEEFVGWGWHCDVCGRTGVDVEERPDRCHICDGKRYSVEEDFGGYWCVEDIRDGSKVMAGVSWATAKGLAELKNKEWLAALAAGRTN